MPKNRFPDTLAKRELRRRDGRNLASFKDKQKLAAGLEYCGMPSVEFLDILAWLETLRSVCAIEYDDDILRDMKIQKDLIPLELPVRFVNENVLAFLYETNDCYDVYNLDFFGGFINPTRGGGANCTDSIRRLIERQSAKARSFALITTFNVRDRGAQEYLGFIDQIPKALGGYKNVDLSCKAHQKNQATRLKVCYPYFCWDVGRVNNFLVHFTDPFVYDSSVTLVHFYAEFLYEPRTLPNLSATDVLVSIANRPLMRMDGMIRTLEMRPPEIESA